MKLTAALLAMLMTGSQTVSFTNCCRGPLCDQKDDCPPCREKGPEGRTPDDCCGDEAPRDTNRSGCVHLEPSSDVDSAALPGLPSPPSGSVVLDLNSPREVLSHAAAAEVALVGIPPPDTPAPLYLLQLSLRL